MRVLPVCLILCYCRGGPTKETNTSSLLSALREVSHLQKKWKYLVYMEQAIRDQSAMKFRQGDFIWLEGSWERSSDLASVDCAKKGHSS